MIDLIFILMIYEQAYIVYSLVWALSSAYLRFQIDFLWL